MNPAIRSLRRPSRFFSTDPATLAADTQLSRDNWRPLTTLSFALNYRLLRLDPFSYHLFNLILHLLNGLLVFFLALRLAPAQIKKRRLFAFLAGAIFLLHPVQTETVDWVSQRSGLLSLFFLLLAWHADHQARAASRRGASFAWRAAGIGGFALSLLCKEAGVMRSPSCSCYRIAGSSPPPRRWSLAAACAISLTSSGRRGALVAATSGLWSGRWRRPATGPEVFFPTFLTTLKGFAVYVKLLLGPLAALGRISLYGEPIPQADPAALGAVAPCSPRSPRWLGACGARTPWRPSAFFFLPRAGPRLQHHPDPHHHQREVPLHFPLIGFALAVADLLDALGAGGKARRHPQTRARRRLAVPL